MFFRKLFFGLLLGVCGVGFVPLVWGQTFERPVLGSANINIGPTNLNNNLKNPSALSSFGKTPNLFSSNVDLTKLFPGTFTLGSWPPRYTTPSILPRSQNVFQPNPIKGVNIFEQLTKKK